MTNDEQQAREACELALQHLRVGEVEAALACYDRARELARSEELIELITIRKAEALIAAERDGEEIGQLAQIVMRRRSPRHVYLAAGTLMRRFTEQDDRRRAIFYGEIARKAAMSLADPFARASILNYLGITLVADSQFSAAIHALDEALASFTMIRECPDPMLGAAIRANLGGAKILSGDVQEGIRLTEAAVDKLDDEYARAEALLDLAFGYMQLEKYKRAERLAKEALSFATVGRQLRNGNHLLGEIAVRRGRVEEALKHFDVVASYYPGFKNVTQLLVTVDLCSVVNWKI
jgi:tetratricopeptide (TPR) repeat protein